MSNEPVDVLIVGAGASGAAVAWSLAETRMNILCLEQGDAGSPIQVSNFNAVGGSTILYAAHFPRFHPGDFRIRTLDGVGDDWPLDYRRLEPWYDLNARMMGVSGLAGDPAYPPKELPLPPLALGRLGETMARGFNALGWHWWPSDSAITSREYEGRAACINAGTCLIGCAQGAKADVKNLFIVDGSIFVTAAAVNPTNTIQALALHVADTIKKNLANLFD